VVRRLGAFAVVSFVGEGVGCVEQSIVSLLVVAGDVEFGGERACVCGTLVVLEEFVVGEAGAEIELGGCREN